MKAKTIEPAVAPGLADAAELVANLKTDIAALKSEIVSAELHRDAKALELDNDAFEKHVLDTERNKRRLLRLRKQLELAEVGLADAKAREATERKAALYEAGVRAVEEVERLADEYALRAAAVVETLREIQGHTETIRIAPYSLRFDIPGVRISESVILPSASVVGEYVWSRGEPAPSLPKHPGYVEYEGVLVQFDASNPDHVAARATEKPTPVRTHLPAPQPGNKAGPQVLGNGMRKFTMPACEWPPKATD